MICNSCNGDDGFPPYETTAIVKLSEDSSKTPVESAKVTIRFDHVTDRLIFKHTGNSNASGIFSAKDKSIGIFNIDVTKPSHYPISQDYLTAKNENEEVLRLVEFKFIMRKIINPIPLHAKSNDLPIPGTDQWIGFDLQKSDWIAPYGKGTESDIEFLLHNQSTRLGMHGNESISDAIEKIVQLHEQHPRHKTAFMEQRDQFFMLPVGTSTYDQAIDFKMHLWSGKLKMRVPHDKGGMIAEKERYLIYSRSPQSDYVGHRVAEMRMPHHAPLEGYLREHQWEKSPNFTPPPDEKLGFFIKTRIKTDESGNIISAHYAKIIQDLEIDIRGRIKFTSYFNPTPNDTNLEFDPNKNLTPHLKDLEKPYLP
jgi:hypothetical protein